VLLFSASEDDSCCTSSRAKCTQKTLNNKTRTRTRVPRHHFAMMCASSSSSPFKAKVVSLYKGGGGGIGGGKTFPLLYQKRVCVRLVVCRGVFVLE
jgi:hypothetical protein